MKRRGETSALVESCEPSFHFTDDDRNELRKIRGGKLNFSSNTIEDRGAVKRSDERKLESKRLNLWLSEHSKVVGVEQVGGEWKKNLVKMGNYKKVKLTI